MYLTTGGVALIQDPKWAGETWLRHGFGLKDVPIDTYSPTSMRFSSRRMESNRPTFIFRWPVRTARPSGFILTAEIEKS